MNIEDMVLLIDSLRNRTDLEDTTIHAVLLDMAMGVVYENGITTEPYPEEVVDGMIDQAFRLADMLV